MEKEDIDHLIEKNPSLEGERLGLERLHSGTYCLHRTFGMGQIVGYDSGENKLVIDFDEAGQRRMDPEFCLRKYAKIDLFICSGKPEYENIIKNYGYKKNEVAYTGFPRLDYWHNITINKRQILIMPTWRAYLAHDKELNICETFYFKTYQSLLNNRKLNSFLESNSLEAVFYLHHEMRKYVDKFKSKTNPK